MFTDAVGFTARAQDDERAALRLLDGMARRVRPVFRRHRGREVKSTGDGFLVEFASALDAVLCALEIQRAAPTPDAGGEAPLLLRVGIHLGDVVERDGDVVGDAVNLAARIEPLADPGGICVSQQVADQVANKLSVPLTRLPPRALKNVRTPLGIYKVELGPSSPGAPSRGEGRRVAVLPIVHPTAAPTQEYLADGLTEELIVRLARVEGLQVLARSTVMRYKGTLKPAAEVARELGVGAVLEGTLRTAGDRLRLTVMLVDAKTESAVWSQAYDGQLADVFAVEADIAQRIAASLEVRLAPREVAALGQPSTTVPAAYESYLRGRYFWNRRTADSLERAVAEYRAALQQDPNFALAHAGLADTYATQALLEFARPSETFPSARAEAERALALDPDSAEALTALGVVRGQFDRDWVAAEEAFQRALARNPRYPAAHHQYADLLKALGRFPEALAEVQAALALDPLSLAINTGLGHVLYLSRRNDEAIAQYRRTLELDPTFVLAHLWFGRPFLEEGRYDEAIAEIEQAVALSHRSTMATAVLAHACASAGRRLQAERLLAELLARVKTGYVPSVLDRARLRRAGRRGSRVRLVRTGVRGAVELAHLDRGRAEVRPVAGRPAVRPVAPKDEPPAARRPDGRPAQGRAGASASSGVGSSRPRPGYPSGHAARSTCHSTDSAAVTRAAGSFAESVPRSGSLRIRSRVGRFSAPDTTNIACRA